MSEPEIVFAVERLTPELAIEANPLLDRHGGDVYAHWRSPEKLTSNPQMLSYFIARDAGVLICATARTSDGRLVGYGVVLVDNHPHVGVLYGRLDMLFMEDELRSSVYSRSFLPYIEDLVRAQGAKFLYFGVPPRLALSLEKRGWFPEEVGCIIS